jgi:thiol-disulfide isomerase/thioredoxin
VAFLYDSRDRLLMYFVSERGRYEFLLPGGRYELECVGEGPAGIETERVRVNLDIEKGQPSLDVGAIDLAATRLAELFDKPAPDLKTITHWRGQKPPRLARLQGHVVVLVFWGGWSRPCLQTMPQLIELHDLYAEQGVVIIAIHDNSVETVPELEAELTEARQLYWGRRDVPFAVGIDSGPGRGSVHQDYGVEEWPTTIVVDRAGNVAGKYSPWGELQAELPRLLSEQSDQAFTR